jgi:hypothetical protein
VSALLSRLSLSSEVQRQAALARECPFVRGSELYRAWWRAVRQVRGEAKKEREGVR